MPLRPRSSRRTAAGAVAAVAVTLLAAACGQAARPGSPGRAAAAGVPARVPARAPAGAGFGWLRPRPAPAGWLRAGLPGQAAVLAYPAWLRPQPGDAGTVTAGLRSRTGMVLAYLNVTPRQGAERLPGWIPFRLAHLREDGDTAVRLVATSAAVRFRGGRGRCVMDDYTTRVGGNRYREIACLVLGRGSASVLVAATPAAGWGRYGGVLEEAVSAYQAG